METGFSRYIGIDWSGAKNGGRGSIAVAKADGTAKPVLVRRRPTWDRARTTKWIIEEIETHKGDGGILIGLDFCFGYPAGAAKVVFGANKWIELPFAVRDLLEKCENDAKKAVAEINSKCECGGPFRIGHKDRRFDYFLRNKISRFRITELFAPGALSAWDDVEGAQVALSTLTGLSALADIIDARTQRKIDFKIFPFENCSARDVVLAEVYPSLAPRYSRRKKHAGDALKITRWLQTSVREKGAKRFMRLPASCLRYCGQSVDTIREEGWILGVSI